MVQIRPLGDRVLVTVLKRDRVTGGGVVLPDNVREESDRGIVMATGEDESITVAVGEVVLFSPYAGVKVSADNEDFLLLRINDVLGVVGDVPVDVTRRLSAEEREALPSQ